MLVLSILLVIGIVLTGGCLGKETGTPTEPPAQEIPPPINEPEPPPQEAPPQIIESIPSLDAFSLIQENQDNSDFVIIDVRTPEEFTEERIENAINIDYRSETLQDELDELDKNQTYLIYCRSGGRSGNALDTMEELNFKEVYNLLGGINQWKAEGLSTIQEAPIQVIESIPPLDAFSLIQDNQGNPNFVIIDIQTPEDFAKGHIENAININYHSETFRDELDTLDRNKTYLIYYECACGGRDTNTLEMMEELDFQEVYKISGGLRKWKSEGLPTVK